jgi:cytidylate kinase
MRPWTLVTGGVASGIGKGCLSAVLCRVLSRAHGTVAYRKIEPCLQAELGLIGNDAFGEVVLGSDGRWWDGDTARVAFYCGAVADVEDQSVERALVHARRAPGAELEPAPRLVERIAKGLFVDTIVGVPLVVEIGGTAGELEHQLVVEALRARLGSPTLHLHVTTYATVGGRRTTKPAEVSLRALHHPPDAVFVRNAAGAAVSEWLPRAIVVMDDEWPERAWHDALQRLPEALARRLEIHGDRADPLFDTAEKGSVPVRLVTDVAHPDAYASLLHRLRAWSRGRIHVVERRDACPAMAEVRIGERSPPSSHAAVKLEIVPLEHNAEPRDRRQRPDWHGTADAPGGAVFEFMRRVLTLRGLPIPVQGYATADFAADYCRRSVEGSLRDHGLVDLVVERALPVGRRLQAARILDLGCGWGRWARRLTADGARVVGIEPSLWMAERARDLVCERFELHVGTLLDAPLSGEFDVALASLSLDHESDLDGVLRRIGRHLRPRGRVIVSTEHPLRTATLHGERWTEDRCARVRDYLAPGPRDHAWFGSAARVRIEHRTIEGWSAAFRDAGLRIVSIHEPGDPRVDNGVPRFWVIVAERPGVAPALVTIDGTAGSGKSTLGRRVSEALGWDFLDTGDLRRALVLRNSRDSSRSKEVTFRRGSWRIQDIVLSPDELRGAPVDDLSLSPAYEEESAFIDAALAQPLVMVGRGLGRHYDAAIRVQLDAPVRVRASRHGTSPDEIAGRDQRDREGGRLLNPDVAALVLDGSVPLELLVESVVRSARDAGPMHPLPRAQEWNRQTVGDFEQRGMSGANQ